MMATQTPSNLTAPTCRTCHREWDIHGTKGDLNGWDHDFEPMSWREWRAHNRGQERITQAMYYAWGREDQGDRRLRDVRFVDSVLAMDFAYWAGAEALAYAEERSGSLNCVQDQYDRWVAGVMFVGALMSARWRRFADSYPGLVSLMGENAAREVIAARDIGRCEHGALVGICTQGC